MRINLICFDLKYVLTIELRINILNSTLLSSVHINVFNSSAPFLYYYYYDMGVMYKCVVCYVYLKRLCI